MAAQEKGRLNPPTEYIGQKIFPRATVAEKSGSFWYQTLAADSAAQTSRTAGNAPTGARLTTTEGSYYTAGYEKRYLVSREETKSFGGTDNADLAGVAGGARSVFRAHEDVCAGLVIDATGYAARYATTSGKVLEGISKAAQSVKRYPGRTVLACSEDWYLDFLSQSDVKAAIQATFGNARFTEIWQIIQQDPRATVKFMLAIIMFDEILIGDNDHWQVDNYQDAAAILRIPREDEVSSDMDTMMLYKERALYGLSHWWLPDPAEEMLFYAESFYDDNDKDNKYDVTGWFNVQQLNAGAKKLVTLPSPTFATTTTTTTTTT
jgi:hypothetical protein